MDFKSTNVSPVLTDPAVINKSRLGIHSSLLPYAQSGASFSSDMLTIPRKKPGKLDDVRSNGWLDAMKSSSPPSKKILKNCNVEVALDDSDVAYCSWMLSYPSALNSFEKIINRARNKKMIVNGPEVLSKFVGETEKNVRDLFADAEQDQRTQGDQSDLHVIIFDEIDAICKSRGSTRDGTGVHDSIVNQLLTKIDDVESLNNVLLIGMTNRKDLLDEALLRPGRLEVQVEISLPDEHGRLQILQIHTNNMKENCTRILDSMSIFGRIKYFWMDVNG